ncbi:MAG: creatininase family protein [Eubacteriales bacterium]|jgi:creatinine amidohydrolase
MFTDLNRYTWEEVAAMDMEHTYYVLPISSLEQHGKHLAMGADDFILQCALKELYKKEEITANMLCLPILHYGNSHEHLDFKGVVSFSCDTIVAIIRDILRCMKMHGVKNLIILNSHGGNSSLIDAYAQEWEVEFGIHVYTISLWAPGFFRGAELGVETPLAHEIHAGEMETSILMYGMPEMVRKDKISEKYDVRLNLREYYAGWNSADLSPDNGVMGVASKATVQKGEAIVKYMGDRMCSYLLDIQNS